MKGFPISLAFAWLMTTGFSSEKMAPSFAEALTREIPAGCQISSKEVCAKQKCVNGYVFAYGGGSVFGGIFDDVFNEVFGRDDGDGEGGAFVVGGRFDIEAGTGYILGGGVGFRPFPCQGIRVELEGLYSELPGTNLSAEIAIAPFGAAAGNNPLAGNIGISASFVNVLKEFHFDAAPRLTTYFGGGLGYANVDLNLNVVGGPALSGSDGAFAAQVIFGADYDLNDTVAVFLQYKALYANETSYVLNGVPTNLDSFWNDNLVGGLRIAF